MDGADLGNLCSDLMDASIIVFCRWVRARAQPAPPDLEEHFDDLAAEEPHLLPWRSEICGQARWLCSNWGRSDETILDWFELVEAMPADGERARW
jgi:hypothetical protein